MKNKSSRYRDSNTKATRRSRFYKQAAWQWLLANRPDVIELIKDEGYKRFPGPRRYWQMDPPDYAFLGLKSDENARRTK